MKEEKIYVYRYLHYSGISLLHLLEYCMPKKSCPIFAVLYIDGQYLLMSMTYVSVFPTPKMGIFVFLEVLFQEFKIQQMWRKILKIHVSLDKLKTSKISN